MEIFFKNNSRIKGIARPDRILCSRTSTNGFPPDSVVVSLKEVGESNPNFTFYFTGKNRACRVIVYLNYCRGSNEYKVSFFGGGMPIKELSNAVELIHSIKNAVITNTPIL